jgi:hypothetical protein
MKRHISEDYCQEKMRSYTDNDYEYEYEHEEEDDDFDS